MDIFIAIMAVLAGLIGIVGSVLPALPGPPVSWIGILLLYFWGGTNGNGDPMPSTILLSLLAVTIVVTVVDYIVPIYFTRLSGGSKYGAWGCTIGLVAGLFFPQPVGMISGGFIGAFIAELILAQKDTKSSLKSAFGSFIGFILGTGLKLAASFVMFYYIMVYV